MPPPTYLVKAREQQLDALVDVLLLEPTGGRVAPYRLPGDSPGRSSEGDSGSGGGKDCPSRGGRHGAHRGSSDGGGGGSEDGGAEHGCGRSVVGGRECGLARGGGWAETARIGAAGGGQFEVEKSKVDDKFLAKRRMQAKVAKLGKLGWPVRGHVGAPLFRQGQHVMETFGPGKLGPQQDDKTTGGIFEDEKNTINETSSLGAGPYTMCTALSTNSRPSPRHVLLKTPDTFSFTGTAHLP